MNPEPIRNRVPPTWGGPLSESDYAALAACWIAPAVANEAMLRRVDTFEGREVICQKGKRDCAGILFSYYWPDEPGAFNYRVRRDNPDWTVGKDGKPKPERKYLGPPNSGNRLYIPPGVTRDQLQDITIPIAIVEGEKKALALWRLARYETDRPRFIPVAIAGVWCWRGKVGKANGTHGERIDLSGPIADLSRIEWNGRKTFVLFDANVTTNDSVKWARKGIARELATRHAEVAFVNLPEDCGVNGVDDLLAAWGPSRVLELFASAAAGAHLKVLLPPQFQSSPAGMFRITKKGELLTETQLSNYRASIKANVRLDDGVETKREFEIESALLGRSYQFTIPVSQFASMDWPIEQMGSGAITFPNQREYTRTAIQCFSMTAEDRCIYTHTGWRKVESHWVYLHANGAIGAVGIVAGINVRLIGSLARYELRLANTKESLVLSLQASLLLLKLGPPEISFPLRAATCRAVFGDSDFALHVTGETGAFKSELVALEQQHFGQGMNRLHLPGAWSSTANANEVLAFHAKDALIVIDDFAPQGSAADIGKYHAAADRVFRAAGNGAGRSRLDSTARLRDAKPPRGLILSTGEDVPRGHSVRARLLILELSKGAINVNKLTECQRAAETGLYAEAMGGFVRWIAGRYEEKQAALAQRVAELRISAARHTAHARTPEIIANLQAAFEAYLEFSEECGAINAGEREHWANRSWDALRATAIAQVRQQAANEPAARFLDLLRGCLASGQAHLAARDGTEPEDSPECCGWRRNNYGKWSAAGDCIGWIDGEDIYLEPTVAYRIAQTAGREGGEILPISEQTLRKRLREKGLLASIDEKRETLTVRRSVAGSIKVVLHLGRRTLFLDQFDSFGDHGVTADESERAESNVGFPCREISSPNPQPDTDFMTGINHLHCDCRKCRVSRRGEGPGKIIAPSSVDGPLLRH
jgi:hypothetical protein